MPGYDVEIVDDDGRPVTGDAAGHLEVRGPSMAVGYWCDQAASQRSFHGDRMRTGDMYARSDDGYYTYLGRSDDMLRVGGEWVSPAEVEAVLISHAAVLEAAVVGQRDERRRTTARSRSSSPRRTRWSTSAELEALCKSELAGYKRPKRYEVVPELPKTATGKIQRFKLRSS